MTQPNQTAIDAYALGIMSLLLIFTKNHHVQRTNQ